LEFKPVSIPGLVWWPAYDEELSWGMECDQDLRQSLGIGREEYVVTYTGNLHLANAAEIRSLYLAVALVNRRGLKLRLVRTGEDYAALTDHAGDLLRANLIELGLRPRTDLPRLLSIADVLVQPGRADEFNIYRFPSKLPEFLASRRAVILPKCNIGYHLEHGRNAIILREGNALEIACALEQLLPDAARRKSLGMEGAAFAAKHLRWNIAAGRLIDFYEQLRTAAPVERNTS